MLEKLNGIGTLACKSNIFSAIGLCEASYDRPSWNVIYGSNVRRFDLGSSIHFLGTYLNFNRQAIGADQSRMQTLIPVAFRNGDIVFEPPGLGLIEGVQCAECGITGWNAVDNDAEAVNIHNLGKAQLSPSFSDGCLQVFFPAFDFGLYIRAYQPLAECAQDFADNVLPVLPALVHRFLKSRSGWDAGFGTINPEALDMRYSNLYGWQSVHRFQGFPLQSGGVCPGASNRASAYYADGRQVYDNHAHIFGHRQNQFAETA